MPVRTGTYTFKVVQILLFFYQSQGKNIALAEFISFFFAIIFRLVLTFAVSVRIIGATVKNPFWRKRLHLFTNFYQPPSIRPTYRSFLLGTTQYICGEAWLTDSGCAARCEAIALAKPTRRPHFFFCTKTIRTFVFFLWHSMSFDYLIVGAGVAGSLLAWHLQELGVSVLLVDRPNPAAASHVAAGIINPVTGRRIVKARYVDEIIAHARQFYTSFEQQVGAQVYSDFPIYRIFRSEDERMLWEQRSTRPDYACSMGGILHTPALPTALHTPFGAGEILGGGWVQLSALLPALHHNLAHTSLALENSIAHKDIQWNGTCAAWNGITAKRVVFCEGWRGVRNPAFSFLPFLPSYGETVVFSAPELHTNAILNADVHIVPLGNHLFKAGATNKWDITNETPSEEGKSELMEKISAVLTVPYQIVEHAAGIRPSIADRRPVAGVHPQYPYIGILNGLGSKGVSFGPWAAHHFAQFLVNNTPLPPFIDIARFNAA